MPFFARHGQAILIDGDLKSGIVDVGGQLVAGRGTHSLNASGRMAEDDVALAGEA